MPFVWENQGLTKEIVPEYLSDILPCSVVVKMKWEDGGFVAKNITNIGIVAGFYQHSFAK